MPAIHRRRLLEAMGYQLWVRADRAGAQATSVAAAVSTVAAASALVDAELPTAIPASSQPIALAPAPTAAPARSDPPLQTESAADVPDPRVPSGPVNALWSALLAAAAQSPERADANGLRLASSGVAVEYVRDELWIDPVALCQQAGAKRALWKTLRALRRAELARRS